MHFQYWKGAKINAVFVKITGYELRTIKQKLLQLLLFLSFRTVLKCPQSETKLSNVLAFEAYFFMKVNET